MTPSSSLVLALIALVSFCMSYLGAAVGLVLGQFRVVLLTYALGSAALGGATSLAISTVAAIVGAVVHVREGRVNLALLASIGGPSALSAHATARYAGQADPRLLKGAIACALLVTGLHMLRPRRRLPDARRPESAFPSGTRSFAGQVAVGALLGAVSGLVGLLLGSLRLPAMARLTGVAPATAVGTNMAIGAITGISAGVTAAVGGSVDLVAFAVITPLTLIGAHYGARKTGGLDAATLTKPGCPSSPDLSYLRRSATDPAERRSARFPPRAKKRGDASRPRTSRPKLRALWAAAQRRHRGHDRRRRLLGRARVGPARRWRAWAQHWQAWARRRQARRGRQASCRAWLPAPRGWPRERLPESPAPRPRRP
jgi:uncharacterized membrane protein YfcA